MIARFLVFLLPKRGHTWLIFSDGKMVEIGGNLALISENLARFRDSRTGYDRGHRREGLGGGVLFPTINHHGFSFRGRPEYC